jgi:hypothetical protein
LLFISNTVHLNSIIIDRDVYDWISFIVEEEDCELEDLLSDAIVEFVNNYKFKREFKRMGI